MKFIGIVSLVSGSLALTSNDGECTYALEVVQIQDGSSSFTDHIDTMRRTANQLVEALGTNFGEFRYGVTSFVDKPIPLRGMGLYGNYKSTGSPVDWCYRTHAPLTDDPDVISKGLENLVNNMGSGGDYPENPYEGMLFAAYSKDAGWSPREVTHAKSGRPIARILIMFTDDVPHLPTDAWAGTSTGWNWPRDYTDPDNSSGGFGAKTWGQTHFIYYPKGQADKDEYNEMSDLFKTVDLGGVLNKEEEARLDALIKKFGPYPWPEVLAHPGDDSLDCSLTEYPSLEQLAAALKKYNIIPIILVATPTTISKDTAKRCDSIGSPASDGILKCLVNQYTRDLETMGISGVVDTISSGNVLEQMVQAIATAVEKSCLTTTPPPVIPHTTQPALTSAQDETNKPDETSSEHAHTSPQDDTTEATTEDAATAVHSRTTEDATAVHSRTTEHATSVGTTTATAEAHSSTTSSSKKKSGVAVIAGAAGGAAGLAALGGVLYKQLGMNLFGGQSTPSVNTVQQVETPENPIERETMEEVTMDMFQ